MVMTTLNALKIIAILAVIYASLELLRYIHAYLKEEGRKSILDPPYTLMHLEFAFVAFGVVFFMFYAINTLIFEASKK